MGPEGVNDLRLSGAPLIEVIRERGIGLEVLNALTVSAPPLHPDAVWHRAYEGTPLPIGFGQTAHSRRSRRSTSRRCAAADGSRLEVRTGGYQTALLAQLAGHLLGGADPGSRSARAAIDALRINNVAARGRWDHRLARYAFDAILVAAARRCRRHCSSSSPGWRLLIPVGTNEQRLTLFVQTERGWKSGDHIASSFR